MELSQTPPYSLDLVLMHSFVPGPKITGPKVKDQCCTPLQRTDASNSTRYKCNGTNFGGRMPVSPVVEAVNRQGPH